MTRFPVREFALLSAVSFRGSLARTPWTKKIVRNHARASTHTQRSPTQLPSYTTPKHPCLSTPRNARPRRTTCSGNLNHTSSNHQTPLRHQTAHGPRGEGEQRQNQLGREQSRHALQWVHEACPVSIKLLRHNQLQTLLKRQFSLTQRSQTSK